MGKVAEASITAAFSAMWRETTPDQRSEILVGLGYTIPYLDRFAPECHQTLNLMPAGQGAVYWPSVGPSSTALVFEDQLPLPDSSVHRMIMVHLLENTQTPLSTLREAWRVLAPGGKLFIVVPNRRGLWARSEHTPFGMGRPFSRSQFTRLLADAHLSAMAWSEALCFPPSANHKPVRFYRQLERFGRYMWPAFCGAMIVLATKQLYSGIRAERRDSRSILVPEFAPQPTSCSKLDKSH